MGVNEQKWKQNWNVIWNISRKKVVKPEIFRPSIVFLQEQHRVMFSCHWTCRKLLTLSLRRVHVNGRIIELHWYKYRIDSSAVILEWITFVSSGKSTETWSWKKAAVLCSHMRSHERKRREKSILQHWANEQRTFAISYLLTFTRTQHLPLRCMCRHDIVVSNSTSKLKVHAQRIPRFS